MVQLQVVDKHTGAVCAPLVRSRSPLQAAWPFDAGHVSGEHLAQLNALESRGPFYPVQRLVEDAAKSQPSKGRGQLEVLYGMVEVVPQEES